MSQPGRHNPGAPDGRVEGSDESHPRVVEARNVKGEAGILSGGRDTAGVGRRSHRNGRHTVVDGAVTGKAVFIGRTVSEGAATGGVGGVVGVPPGRVEGGTGATIGIGIRRGLTVGVGEGTEGMVATVPASVGPRVMRVMRRVERSGRGRRPSGTSMRPAAGRRHPPGGGRWACARPCRPIWRTGSPP